MIQAGNDTTVTVGLMAGATCTIIWWALGTFAAISAPAEVIAASVTLLTGLAQFFLPLDSPNE